MTGDPWRVSWRECISLAPLISAAENLASHRTQALMEMLPWALMYGALDTHPKREPLKVIIVSHQKKCIFLPKLQNLDTDAVIQSDDTESRFILPGLMHNIEEPYIASTFESLCKSWEHYDQRGQSSESQWVVGLTGHLEHLINRRVSHVQDWIIENTERFASAASASIDPLQREFEQTATDLRTATSICAMTCNTCHLSCLQRRDHEGFHDCHTTHMCSKFCKYTDEHAGSKDCGLP